MKNYIDILWSSRNLQYNGNIHSGLAETVEKSLDFGIFFGDKCSLFCFYYIVNLNNPDGLRLNALPLLFALFFLEIIKPGSHSNELSLVPCWEQ